MDKQILIIDDDRIIRDNIAAFLEDLSFQVRKAENGQEGVDQIEKQIPDLVLVDLHMPKMNGFQVIEFVTERFKALPVIVISGAGEIQDAANAINLGAWDYIIKPVKDLSILEHSISKSLEKRELILENIKYKNYLEEEIQKRTEAQSLAEKSNRVKSEFLARMSHEIRTPLNSILGFSEILLETDLDEKQKGFLDAITQSGEVLSDLINDILDLSKIEAGQLKFESKDFSPEQIIFEVCELILPKIADKSIEVICKIEDSVPTLLKGDPFRFKQVLVNLIGNSVKFTDEGTIEIHMAVIDSDETKVKTRIEVKDTGIGIRADNLAIIFDDFIQADETITRKYGGTGLGLPICKKIASHMGGDIFVDSTFGVGSTFHFHAWFDKTKLNDIPYATPEFLKNIRVLLIGGIEQSQTLLKSLLEEIGTSVDTTPYSKDVAKQLNRARTKKKGFDICIVDLQQSPESGFEIAETIRSLKNDISKTIILAHASINIKKNENYFKCKFDAFLPKPIGKTKLLSIIENLFLEASEKEDTQIYKISQFQTKKRKKKILLVEDNPLNQKLIIHLLSGADFEVRVANDGEEAVRLVETESPYELIFMDVQMPNMSGYEATKMIREKGFRDIPIIALTAQTMKSDQQRCLDSGMNGFISKPIKKETIFNSIKRWSRD